MNWTYTTQSVDRKTIKYHIFQDSNQVLLSYQQVLKLWIENAGFRQFFNQILADNPFEAFFWEVRPITKATLQDNFEFVLVDSPSLARIQADSRPFETKFVSDDNIVTFHNLRKDALLVVPNAHKTKLMFPHIAAFVRNAPVEWINEFWEQIGVRLSTLISNESRWLSTSGLGVYWVHVRMDSFPKYYTHRAYC